MPYIITNGTEYIMKDRKGKYVTIRNAAMADEFTKETAHKILHNQIAKRIRATMRIEKVDDGKTKELPETDTHSTVVEFEISDNIQVWIDKLSDLNGLAVDANTRKNELTSQLTIVDKKLSDVLHYCEFTTLNACQGFKLYKMIRDLRQERRMIKNELEVVNFILGKKITDSVSEEAQKLIHNIQTKRYEPRILTELFDV